MFNKKRAIVGTEKDEKMNSKSTGRPTGRPTGGKATARPDARSDRKAFVPGKVLRPSEKTLPSQKTPAGEGYGLYRETAPAAKVTPPLGRAPAPPALAEALRVVAAEVKALKNEVAQKDTEIKAVQKRLTQMEVRQKAQEKAYRAAQYPARTSAPPAPMEEADGVGTADAEEAA